MFILLFILFLFLNIYLVYSSSKLFSIIVGLPINIAGSIYFSQEFFYPELRDNNNALILFLFFTFIFILASKKILYPVIEKSLSEARVIDVKEIEYISYIFIIISTLALILNFSNLNFYSELRNTDLSQSGLKHIYTQFLIFPKLAASSGILLFYFNLKHKKSIKFFLLSFLQVLPISIITLFFGFRRSEFFHLLSPFIIFSIFTYAPNIIQKITKNKKRILSLLISIFLISGLSIEYTGPIRKYTYYCVVFGDCDMSNIREFYITDKERYRIPGESININTIVDQLNNNKIDYDFGTSSLNMILFRFFPDIIIGQNLRQIVRENFSGRVKDLLAYTPPAGIGDSILSFGYFAPIKWIYSISLFVIFFRIIRNHNYFLLISLPPISSIFTHMFTHHLDLVAPDLIFIFLTYKFINLSLNLFDKKIKSF